MIKSIGAGIVGLGLLAMLSGCGGSAPAISGAAQTVISEVNQLTVGACKFLPAEQAVESIFAAADPILSTPQAIADAICASVNGAKKSSLRKFTIHGMPVITVNDKPFIVNGRKTQ